MNPDPTQIALGAALPALLVLWRWVRRRRLRVQVTTKHARFYGSFRPSEDVRDEDGDTDPGRK